MTKEIVFKNGKIDMAKAKMEDVFNLLKSLTDEDFNGNNGEDYFVDGKSELEGCMKKYGELDIQSLIEYTLDCNYNNGGCYEDYNIAIDNVGDILIVTIAVIEVI